MPTPPRFWDRIAEKYAARPVDDEAAYADTLARTRAYLGPEMRALELGCGTGTTALKLADAVAELAATDYSSGMIAIARAKPAAPNVTFTVAEIAEVTPPEGGYDAVLAFNLLHLVPDLGATLARIAALTRPGGMFVSKSGCLAEAGFHIRLLLPAMRLVGKAPELTRLAAATLEDAIRRAGFELVETRTYPGLAPTRFVAARRI